MKRTPNGRKQALLWLAAAALLGVAVSAGVSAAASRVAPSNLSPPTIDGKAQERQTLTANAGRWRGTQPITYRGTWLRCNIPGGGCAPIPGANSPTYTLTKDDVDHTIRVSITASNKDGSATARSAPTPTVKPAPANAPANTSAPTIGGSAAEGQTLTGVAGEWDGTQPITFAFQWQRCDKNGLACANISGGSAKTYKATSADVGNTLRLRVIATNSAGKTTAFSRTTGIVSGSGNPPPSGGPPGAIKLPNGQTSIPVTSVSSPERLVIAQAVFTPNPLRSRADVITARFKIVDTRGYVVRGALVFDIPLPYGWTTQPAEVLSETDGWATVTMRANPTLPRRGAIVQFVRARKPGDNLLAGVSSRRLVQMLVSLQ